MPNRPRAASVRMKGSEMNSTVNNPRKAGRRMNFTLELLPNAFVVSVSILMGGFHSSLYQPRST